jgi:pimeloyl-[acyl-carrier protein] methyl ester esterase
MLDFFTQWFKKTRWKELEKEFTGGQAQREYLQFEDSIGTCKVYYLTNPLTEDHEPITGETFVGIHGTGGSSLSFLPLIPHLPLGSRFYFIDLPGFGKSHTTHSNIGVEYYVECLRRCMETLQITQARFIAHSFGAFLTLHFTNLYPSYVKSLILIAPAFLLPTLGYNAYLWAILFKFRFPYFVRYVRWCLRVLSRMGIFSRRTMHMLSCSEDSKSTMGRLVADIIYLGKMAYVKRPVLDKLLVLPVPVSLVYGELDTLIPGHQGLVIRGLRPDVTVDIITGESHNPIARVPQLIVDRSIVEKTEAVKTVPKPLLKKIQTLLVQPERYASYFSFHQTWLSIQRLYVDLLTC